MAKSPTLSVGCVNTVTLSIRGGACAVEFRPAFAAFQVKATWAPSFMVEKLLAGPKRVLVPFGPSELCLLLETFTSFAHSSLLSFVAPALPCFVHALPWCYCLLGEARGRCSGWF